MTYSKNKRHFSEKVKSLSVGHLGPLSSIVHHVFQRILSFIMTYERALIPFEPNCFRVRGKPLHDLGPSIWEFCFPLVSVGSPTKAE